VQWNFSVSIPSINISTMLKERASRFEVSMKDCEMQRSPMVFILGIHICAVIYEPLHNVQRSISACYLQWSACRIAASIDTRTMPKQ